jgi:murein L,D-transpeptidase YafK
MLRRWFTAAALVLALSSAHADNSELWVLVDTQTQTLKVLDGENVQASFSGISIGRNGTTLDKQQDDSKTPLGKFRVAWIKHKSRFHLFFGLDYPNKYHVERAYYSGRIDTPDYLSLRRAIDAGIVPPQDTPLGGYLGIHGVGNGNARVHNRFNWTNGCIALRNEQIDSMTKWIRVGTPVIIR